MTQEARELVERLRKRLGNIDLPQAGTDNLAIVLATYFDDGGEERNKHPAWSDAAIGGAESAIDAIHAHYATTITTLLARAEAAEQGKRVCVARVETLTTCGLAEVALSNPAVMRQWGELTARAEAAERERDEAKLCQQQIAAGTGQSATVARIIIAKGDAEARADKLAAALEPFAAAAEDIDETTPDRAEMWEDPASMNVSAGDFRRARSALADKGVAKNG